MRQAINIQTKKKKTKTRNNRLKVQVMWVLAGATGRGGAGPAVGPHVPVSARPHACSRLQSGAHTCPTTHTCTPHFTYGKVKWGEGRVTEGHGREEEGRRSLAGAAPEKPGSSHRQGDVPFLLSIFLLNFPEPRRLGPGPVSHSSRGSRGPGL